ncbi:MAG TPA: hypothetical protein DCZ94_17620 [Lentisphaeria bacterium]|nr:hypothetical protein [Lentisphaeria bacterium]
MNFLLEGIIFNSNMNLKRKSRKYLVLPRLPSLQRVIKQDRSCEIEDALRKRQKRSAGGKHLCDNSTRWSKSPPATLAEMIKLLRRMEKSGRWIRNLKD